MTSLVSESFLFWASMATLWVGLASVIGLRFCGTAANRACFCRLFYLALVVLGTVTMVAASAGTEFWIPSGTGLSVMTLGATLDFGGARDRKPAF